MLVMETMEENEAIWISGYETYAQHSGYAKTLKYEGDYKDTATVMSDKYLHSFVFIVN